MGSLEEPDEMIISKPATQHESEEVPDLADLEGEDLIDPNAADSNVLFGQTYVSAEEPVDAIMRTRVYDLSLTYDVYYQTPRM